MDAVVFFVVVVRWRRPEMAKTKKNAVTDENGQDADARYGDAGDAAVGRD